MIQSANQLQEVIMRHLSITLLLILASSANAAVYECNVEGQTIYSDQPCGDDAVEIEVKEVNVLSKNKSQQPEKIAENKKAISGYIENANIERRVKTLRSKIKGVNKARDKKIAALKRKSRRANNNLAGATWLESIAQETQAVIQQADSEIRMHQNEIEMLLTSKGK